MNPPARAPGDHAKLVTRMKAIVGNDNVLTAAADMAVVAPASTGWHRHTLAR